MPNQVGLEIAYMCFSRVRLEREGMGERRERQKQGGGGGGGGFFEKKKK